MAVVLDWKLILFVIWCIVHAARSQDSSCTNSYSDAICNDYRRRNLCAYVNQECKLTCGVCTTLSGGSSCKNDFPGCPVTYETDFCSYYGDVCRLACNRCSGGGSTGNWGEWSIYGPCSVTCGQGKQTRNRICNSGSCQGESSSEQSCYARNCPQQGYWGNWGSANACSKTCGKGVVTRTRVCVGSSCPGQNNKKEDCNIQSCPSGWGPWSSQGSCSKTCGGGRITHTRTCQGSYCRGNSRRHERCNEKACSQLGQWSPWGQASVCTVPCGGGTWTRKRTCNGVDCHGQSTKIEKCNQHACGGGENNNQWSKCTKTCGTGTRYRFDTKNCVSVYNSLCNRTFEECNTQSCKTSCPLGFAKRYDKSNGCCKSNRAIARVLNGKQAKIEQWPWMALINSGGYLCGGTIIHEQWILTAAHCVVSNGVTNPAYGVLVYAGIGFRSAISQQNTYKVEKIVIHPQNNHLLYDIALIKLKKKLPFTKTVKTVSTPMGEDTPTDSTCFATGWGLTEPNPLVLMASDPLMEVDLQILDINVCKKAYYGELPLSKYVANSNRLLCAGSLSKTNDVCKGDSGGPLLCQRCSSCDWYVAGVTSFGPKETCGKIGTPGMFTKVKEFENWIFQHIPSLRNKPQRHCSYKYGP